MVQVNYAITIKVIEQGRYASEEELQKIYDFCLEKYKAVHFQRVFEVDNAIKGRLHLHGCFSARKGLYYGLVKIPFVHIHIKVIPSLADRDRWISYCNKDIRKEQRDARKFIQKLEYPFQ